MTSRRLRPGGRLFIRHLFPVVLYLVSAAVAFAGEIPRHSASIAYPISSLDYPVILSGKDLPFLQGKPIGDIAFYRFYNKRFTPIAFQIDRRNKEGRFQIPVTDGERSLENTHALDDNDEIVFMAADLGERRPAPPADRRYAGAAEIIITDPENGQQGWIYALQSVRGSAAAGATDYIAYHPDGDIVETDVYRIGYSRDLPFLIDRLEWRDRETGEFGSDTIDTMKIRHTGRLFHQFAFVRTQDDYTSRLIAVKDGPVRVIRRTANRVHIIWGIGSPTVAIDSIHYRSGFIMDVIVDFPFRIGLLFGDVVTIPVLVLKDDPALPPVTVYSHSERASLPVNGKMSEAKRRFNASGDTALLLSSDFGGIMIDMVLEEDSPVRFSVHLVDDKMPADSALPHPGQYGNVGFRMTDWEKLDSQTHHILFRTYLMRDLSPEEGLPILERHLSFNRHLLASDFVK